MGYQRRPTPAAWQEFAAWLEPVLQDRNVRQQDLGAFMEPWSGTKVNKSQISRYVRGEVGWPPQLLVGLLVFLSTPPHSVPPADLLTALALLGLTWPEVEALVRHNSPPAAAQECQELLARLRRAAEANRAALPPPGGTPQRSRRAPLLPPLTGDYVARPELETRLAQALCTAPLTVVYGAAGLGKTTLVTQVVQSAAVRDHFTGGVLWLRASEPPPAQPYQEWCESLGLQGRNNESWSLVWERWRLRPAGPWLVVLDDVPTRQVGDAWVALLAAASAMVMTTQDGALTVQWLLPWQLPAVQTLSLPAFTPAEGRAFLEQLLKRPLTAPEWRVVEQLGTRLGWHPQALRLMLLSGQAGEWSALLADLQHDGGAVPLGLPEVLQRQWARLKQTEVGCNTARAARPVTRSARLERLWYWLRDNRSFGKGAAAAIWGETPEAASLHLRELELTGLLEPLAQPDPGGYAGPLWRTLPVAQGVLWKPRKLRFWESFSWPRWKLGWRLTRQRESRWKIHWAWRLADAVLTAVMLPVEAPALLLGKLWQKVAPHKPLPRWSLQTFWLLTLAEQERREGWRLPLEYALLQDWSSGVILAPLLVLVALFSVLYAGIRLVPWLNGSTDPATWWRSAVVAWPQWLAQFPTSPAFAFLGPLVGTLGAMGVYFWLSAPVNLAGYRLVGLKHWRVRLARRLLLGLRQPLPPGWEAAEPPD